MVKVKCIVVGELEENCYLLFDTSGQAIVIDPGAEGEKILEFIKREGLEVKYIINTHGHFDHTGANGLVKDTTGALLAIHREDLSLLRDMAYQASIFGLKVSLSPEPDLLVQDGDTIEAGDMRVRVIHTPGHTSGSICVQIEDILFTGDTIFAGSVGRTDLPGGSYEELISSLRDRILPLPDSTILYPGHGPQTILKEERLNNPFLQA